MLGKGTKYFITKQRNDKKSAQQGRFRCALDICKPQTSKDMGANVEGDLVAGDILHTFADEISENWLYLSNSSELDCIRFAQSLQCQKTKT